MYLSLALAHYYLGTEVPTGLWPEAEQDPTMPGIMNFVKTQTDHQLAGMFIKDAPNWGRFWAAQSWQEKLSILAIIAFPPPALLAHRHHSQTSIFRMPAFYIQNWWNLTRHKLPVLLGLLTERTSSIEELDIAVQYRTLRQYLRFENF